MSRRIFERVLPAAQSKHICDILERRAVEHPREEDAERQRGISDAALIEPTVPFLLAEVVALEAVRALLYRRTYACLSGRFPRLTCDSTFFKRAVTGHRYRPHLDGPKRERIATALLYFKDCASGAVVFGEVRDGAIIPRRRLLPKAGRLVIFDDSPANLHWVEPLEQQHRYNVMSWYTARPASGELGLGAVDWVVKYLYSRGETRYLVDPEAFAVVRRRDGSWRIAGRVPGHAFSGSVNGAHLRWLRRIQALGEFSVSALLESAKGEAQQLRGLEVLSMLAKAAAIKEA